MIVFTLFGILFISEILAATENIYSINHRRNSRLQNLEHFYNVKIDNIPLPSINRIQQSKHIRIIPQIPESSIIGDRIIERKQHKILPLLETDLSGIIADSSESLSLSKSSLQSQQTSADDINENEIKNQNLTTTIVPSSSLSSTTAETTTTTTRSPNYAFESSIRDRINDNTIIRSESRAGNKVNGMYSYSDGYYYRTLHYEADQQGYRVISQNVQRIGDGPKFDENGNADISSSLFGKYSITLKDIGDNRISRKLPIGRKPGIIAPKSIIGIIQE